ncbi:hypothetical protein VCV18_005135 [Metarhizium anisopliae]
MADTKEGARVQSLKSTIDGLDGMADGASLRSTGSKSEARYPVLARIKYLSFGSANRTMREEG